VTADVIAEVFERADGKWAWHARAANQEIVASDAGQGYENRADAEAMMGRVLGGRYALGGPLVPDPGMEGLVPVIEKAMQDAFRGSTADLEMAARYVAGQVRNAFWQYRG
jgi:hypothetical protein